MVKIDRTTFESNKTVETLKNVRPPLSWNGEKPFSWRVMIDGRGFNVKKQLLPILLKVTKCHCAFCDLYPLSTDFFDIPIEHFMPKSKNPEKAYSWDNLFPVCNGCTQKKGEKFDDLLLKPDDPNYDFDSNFMVTGEGLIKCKMEKRKSPASITIDIYKLNRGTLLSERKRWIRDFPKINPQNPDEYPFRFLIPIVCKYKQPDDIINKYVS
ncbi:MAG: hypothetical protein R2825_16670 [Saprospiraceae bacterium]